MHFYWNFKGAESYVDNLFLMGSPYPVLAIWVSYMFFILKCGPKFMEKRPAYKLRKILLVYNAFQVAVSCYQFKKGLDAILEFGLLERQFCLVEFSDDVRRRLFDGIHLYFLAKATELLDTVFFVLRKKWDHISYLHVHHHSLMFLFSWLFLKYEPSYTFAFLGTINSFVHAVMYTYYGLSAFPSIAKHLWWKKYITKMQLVQFMMVLLQILCNYIVSPCPTSYGFLFLVVVHIALFTYLFLDFYFKSYMLKENDSSEVETKAQ